MQTKKELMSGGHRWTCEGYCTYKETEAKEGEDGELMVWAAA